MGEDGWKWGRMGGNGGGWVKTEERMGGNGGGWVETEGRWMEA